MLTVWGFGNTDASWAGDRPAPALDPVEGAGYVSGSGGIAVLSAEDGSLLASVKVAAEGGDGNMPDEFNLDLSDCAGQEVIIEAVDACAGGWGWLVIGEIRITNVLIAPPTAGPEISIGLDAEGNITLTWEGVLLQADEVDGQYTEVEGAESPMTVTPDQAQRFFQSQITN